MSNAQGSRVSLAFQLESAFNTPPGAPSTKAIRFNGTTLALNKSILESGEIRGDRQRQDVRHGIHMPAGDIDGELIYGAHDEFWEALLGGTWTSEAAGTPNTLANGTTFRSFLIEAAHNDIAQFRQFGGGTIDKVAISAKPGAIITNKFSIMAASQTVAGTSFDATPAAAVTNSPMDTLANATIKEGGSTIAVVSGIEMTIDNQGAGTDVIGSKVHTDIVQGRMKIDGTVSAYFPDLVLMNKFINETESSLEFTFAGSPTNKTMKFKLPRIKYTGAKLDVQGEGPLVLSLPFQGLYDSVSGYAIQMTRSNP